jgi:DNA invertase Pin-like site-specific DNA recombinase
MLVLGYVRVSSIEQESGYGPQVQEEAIRAYCADKGLSDPEIVHETASAESLVERQQLRDLLARAKATQEDGTPTHVVFYRLDRLARQLTDQESIVGHSMRYGYQLHSTYAAEAETLSPAYAGDPMRVAIRQFFGIFSQLERATIQARLEGGRFAKAKDGGATGGRTPFGYMPKDRDIAVDPESAPIIRRVYELAHHGLDQASIAALVAREHPGPCSHWGKCQISRILARRALYAQGRYRSRLGVVEVNRPELRILPQVLGEPAPVPVATGAPIAWDQFPDPMPMLTLSLLLDRPAAWIQRQITDHGLRATWLKGRMLVYRTAATRLEQIVRDLAPAASGR